MIILPESNIQGLKAVPLESFQIQATWQCKIAILMQKQNIYGDADFFSLGFSEILIKWNWAVPPA